MTKIWHGASVPKILLLSASLFVLYITSRVNYLLFHSIIEIFSVVVAFSIFTISFTANKYIKNSYLIFVGTAYFYIGILDLLHTLSYEGMNVFAGNDYYANQLWIMARFIEAASIMAGFLFIKKQEERLFERTLLSLGIICFIGILSIFYWKIFPVCFVRETGQTAFKIISEYVICLIMAVNIYLLRKHRGNFDTKAYSWLLNSFFFVILTELCFTFYADNYGVSNMIGHFFKLVSYYMIYKALAETGLSLIFNELYTAKDAAEKASLAKSHFFASMSHEIRTPLNSIIGYTQLYEKKFGAGDKRSEYLNNIMISSKHLLSLINNVLDFSKIEFSEITLEDKEFDMEAIISESVSIISPLVNKDTTISYTFNKKLTRPVYGDPGRLRQIMINLAGNSAKFTASGYIKIKCDILGETEENVKIRISVSDTGIGIPADRHGQIFQPFFQQSSQISSRYGGTGLGLNISNHFVKMMGADGIQFNSEAGKGSEFFFETVFKYSGTATAQNLSEIRTVEIGKDARKLKILLVEDNIVNLRLALEILSFLGHEADTAENGLEAVNKVTGGEKFDIILMDVQMPVMDGIEAARKIRASGINIPIIAMTANIFKEEMENCFAAGMIASIPKPFVVKEFQETILRYAEKHD